MVWHKHSRLNPIIGLVKSSAPHDGLGLWKFPINQWIPLCVNLYVSCWWFILCHYQVKGLYLYYDLHMTNGDDLLHQEFSADEFCKSPFTHSDPGNERFYWLFEMRVISFICYLAVAILLCDIPRPPSPSLSSCLPVLTWLSFDRQQKKSQWIKVSGCLFFLLSLKAIF